VYSACVLYGHMYACKKEPWLKPMAMCTTTSLVLHCKEPVAVQESLMLGALVLYSACLNLRTCMPCARRVMGLAAGLVEMAHLKE
jgi:hypothetical protein